MITPQPEADLSLNIIVVGADVIQILKKRRGYMISEDLLKEFLTKDNRRSYELFFDAITFLYSLGFIKESNYKVRLLSHGTQAQQSLF